MQIPTTTPVLRGPTGSQPFLVRRAAPIECFLVVITKSNTLPHRTQLIYIYITPLHLRWWRTVVFRFKWMSNLSCKEIQILRNGVGDRLEWIWPAVNLATNLKRMTHSNIEDEHIEIWGNRYIYPDKVLEKRFSITKLTDPHTLSIGWVVVEGWGV